MNSQAALKVEKCRWTTWNSNVSIGIVAKISVEHNANEREQNDAQKCDVYEHPLDAVGRDA